MRWRGRHRMSPATRRWNALEGEMHVCMSGRPRFAWVGRIQLAPLVWMRGWEAYLGQGGSMQWRLWGLVPLVSLEGGAMDRNGLVRYLAGRSAGHLLQRWLAVCRCIALGAWEPHLAGPIRDPTAAAAEAPVYPMGLIPSSFLCWEAVPGDPDSARAVMSDRGTTASAVFTFDGRGRVVQMRSTDTSRATAGGELEPCPLVARYSGHQRLYDGDHNICIATAGELSFETPEGGEFHYGTFSMVSVAYGK